MTSQEPQNPISVDAAAILDTEVIAVAQPSPVFVDSTGRRSRVLRRVAYGFGALCMLYGGLVSVSLAGGPVSSSAVLPLPDLTDGDDDNEATVTRPTPTPEPITATPSRRPVMQVLPRHNEPVTGHSAESRTQRRSTNPPARPARTTGPAPTTKKPATPTSTPGPAESATTKPATTAPTQPTTNEPTTVPPVRPPGTGGGTAGGGTGGTGGGTGGTGGGTGTPISTGDGDTAGELTAGELTGGSGGGGSSSDNTPAPAEPTATPKPPTAEASL